MKKLISILVCSLLVIGASAQTMKKGSKFISPSLTNLGFNSLSIKFDGGPSQSYSRFGFQATGGYAIKNDLAIEGGIGFQSLNIDSSPLSEFNIFAGARYYFQKGLYANADLVFLSGKGDGSAGGYGTDTNLKATCMQIGAGYDFFLSKKFAIEPSLSYLFSLSAEVEKQDFTLGVFSINLGFIYIF